MGGSQMPIWELGLGAPTLPTSMEDLLDGAPLSVAWRMELRAAGSGERMAHIFVIAGIDDMTPFATR